MMLQLHFGTRHVHRGVCRSKTFQQLVVARARGVAV